MRVNCLSCGHTVDLDDAYEDYRGKIKCFACGAVLEVRIEEGKVKSVEPAMVESWHSTDEVLERAERVS